MADFMRNKNGNLKLSQSVIATQLGYPFSTLQRYRKDTNMLSPYRIQTIHTKNLIERKLQILNSTTIHIASLTLKDLK